MSEPQPSESRKPNQPPIFGQFPNDGIIRNAEVKLELNNDKLADTLEHTAHETLNKLPGVTLKSGDERHQATLEVDHYKLAELWTKALEQQFIQIRNNGETQGMLIDVKRYAHDDGSKVEMTADINALTEYFRNQNEKSKPEVIGIYDPSDVPTTGKDAVKLTGELIGIDPENGNAVIDGQALLKLLQAGLNVHNDKMKHYSEKFSGKPPETADEMEEYMKKSAKFMPGMEVTRDGDILKLTIDSKKISPMMREKSEKYLPLVPGVNVIKPAEGQEADPYKSQFSVDFAKMTEGAVHLAGALLNTKKGITVRQDRDVTTAEFDTNVLRQELLFGALQDAQRKIADQIAEAADKAKPSGVMDVIKFMFDLRRKQGPDTPPQPGK